jgi:hypothetical protein
LTTTRLPWIVFLCFGMILFFAWLCLRNFQSSLRFGQRVPCRLFLLVILCKRGLLQLLNESIPGCLKILLGTSSGCYCRLSSSFVVAAVFWHLAGCFFSSG